MAVLASRDQSDQINERLDTQEGSSHFDENGIIAPQQEEPESMAEKTKAYTATPQDVAAIYGVSAKTVKRWAASMEVPFRQTPSGPRFNLAELDEHFRREPAETPTP